VWDEAKICLTLGKRVPMQTETSCAISALCLAAVLLGLLTFVAAIGVIMSKIRCKSAAADVATRCGTPIAA
jgi:hypothetical protein